MWERAGRLQDACDGSYFNGLPLFTGGAIGRGSGVEFLRFPYYFRRSELELELIQTQMEQKPMLRAEVECAYVAQTNDSGG